MRLRNALPLLYSVICAFDNGQSVVLEWNADRDETNSRLGRHRSAHLGHLYGANIPAVKVLF